MIVNITMLYTHVTSCDIFSLQFICSYVFWPVSWVMGVPPTDCRIVGKLIGIKTFINEFVAYDSLSTIIKNDANLTWYTSHSNYTGGYRYEGLDITYTDFNHTLVGGVLKVMYIKVCCLVIILGIFSKKCFFVCLLRVFLEEQRTLTLPVHLVHDPRF